MRFLLGEWYILLNSNLQTFNFDTPHVNYKISSFVATTKLYVLFMPYEVSKLNANLSLTPIIKSSIPIRIKLGI